MYFLPSFCYKAWRHIHLQGTSSAMQSIDRVHNERRMLSLLHYVYVIILTNHDFYIHVVDQVFIQSSWRQYEFLLSSQNIEVLHICISSVIVWLNIRRCIVKKVIFAFWFLINMKKHKKQKLLGTKKCVRLEMDMSQIHMNLDPDLSIIYRLRPPRLVGFGIFRPDQICWVQRVYRSKSGP